MSTDIFSYFSSLFLGTFILEDASLLAAIALVAQKKISLSMAFWACFLGIAVGDFALYFLGWLGARFGLVRRTKFFSKIETRFQGLQKNDLMTYALIVSRFVPGTRLVTYTFAGFMQFPFLKFSLINIVTVFAWVLLALNLGAVANVWFAENMLLLLVSVFAGFYLLRKLFQNLKDSWSRKILIHSWRKWTHFEFWPAWFFYIPVVPYYILFSIRYRSFYLPFYADPFLENAGLIGESKWDIYKYLKTSDYSLKTMWLGAGSDPLNKIQQLLEEKHFTYPFILKPDVGQRGFAVRVINNRDQLKEYLALAKFDLIIQEYSQWTREAGVFYIREPKQNKGQIFSITDKEFPFVIGDGKTTLGDLILANKRARIMAKTYFQRFGEQIETIPALDEKVFIATCGNHCQGAIFKNGSELKSEELLQSVEKIVKQIPDFYFGRLDIRYLNQVDLKKGLNYKIVEINAAGSEATHIWDANTKLWQAYRTLYQQWNYLFLIGYQVKKLKKIRYPLRLWTLIKEIIKMHSQDPQLAVSS